MSIKLKDFVAQFKAVESGIAMCKQALVDNFPNGADGTVMITVKGGHVVLCTVSKTGDTVGYVNGEEMYTEVKEGIRGDLANIKEITFKDTYTEIKRPEK